MGTRGLIAGTGLLALLLSGCGAETGAQSPADSDHSTMTAGSPSAAVSAQPWLMPDGDTLVACSGDPAFPASRVADGGLELSPEESADVVAALAQMKEDFGIDAPRHLQEAGAVEVQWAVLWQETVGGADQIGLLITEPGATEFFLSFDEYASLEWQGDSWRAASWSGTCRARPFLPEGADWAQLALPGEPAGPAEPADQSDATAQVDHRVDLLVSEVACTSARDPEPHLAEPVVVETAGAVTIYWTTERMVGDATCPGNPWVPRSVQLQEPLGDRALFDGSTFPPELVTTVESYG